MKISHNFDGGNIECINIENEKDIQLKIRKDNKSDFSQWFYFKLSGAKNKGCHMKLLNAGETSYVNGWEDYQAVASYDRKTWFRVDTTFDGKVVTISHMPKHDIVYYAYFEPYSMERHHDLIAQAQMSDLVKHEHLGYTLDNQDMDLLKIGTEGDDKKKCWIIARQHPGESMAEWLVEGMIETLIDTSNPISRELLKKAVFYIVPNMNPDGTRRGNLRTNAAGANLNREWLNATMDHSPEVFLVREKMTQTGVDYCLDVHGDEGLPYNFVAGSEEVPSWNDERQNLQDLYLSELVDASPDFQTKYGYPKGKHSTELLTLGTNYIGETFTCLAMTLEMPFKDTVETPDSTYGWSGQRSKQLGIANLNALYKTIDKL